jgi:hypothetical protein
MVHFERIIANLASKMHRVSEIDASENGPSDREWIEIVKSLDISSDGISVMSCLSLVTVQSMSDISAHIRELGYNANAITGDNLMSLVDATKSLFFVQDLGFCDEQSFSFLMILASYIIKTNGTYEDIAKIFGIRGICKEYIHVDEKRVSIGMISKLFGLMRTGDMSRMDCPRVWDLETDQVVNNPNFGNDSNHPIAAITHRWQAKEIVYEDLMKIEQINVILKKMGQPLESTKISPMCPKLAKIREELKGTIRYIWMDTLCINKTSSVELDMSIRSMYRWYKNAAFVYLEYFTKFDEWCTRGWTFQEGHAAKSLLVSPKHGKFFMELVADMNREDCKKLALDESYGYRDSLYWLGLMEFRQTTVAEDKVYALIGILDVDFQIMYGEGERSMERMCGEIARQKGDMSWLATTRYRDAMNTDKHSLPLEEIWNSQYSDSPSSQEIQLTNIGLRMLASDVSWAREWIHDTYRNIIGYDTIHDDDKFIYIKPNKILLILRGDPPDCVVYSARCVDMYNLEGVGKNIRVNYKNFVNKSSSVQNPDGVSGLKYRKVPTHVTNPMNPPTMPPRTLRNGRLLMP